MRVRKFGLLLAVVTLLARASAQQAVVAMDLGPAAEHAPSSDRDWTAGLTLDHFLTANGSNTPVTPTSATLAWDRTALYVRFRCADPNPVFRAGIRLPRTDQVDVGVVMTGRQEDLRQIAIDRSGKTTVKLAAKATQIADTKVSNEAVGWSAELTIPWEQLGGLPTRPFLLQLARLREITGEKLSPSAVDEHDGPVATALAQPGIDTFIETSLGGHQAVRTAGLGLITLPSGIRRWEHRPSLPRVTEEEQKEISALQRDFKINPTTEANLAVRIRLTELWYDLMEEEGFRFHDGSGDWGAMQGEPDPWTVRHQVNDALRDGNTRAASLALDALLRHFDRVSSTWFADGTPGDVGESSWTPVSSIDSAVLSGNELILHASASGTKLDLFLSFPSTGGMRIRGSQQGYFAPTTLRPMMIVRTAAGVRASSNNVVVDVALKRGWHIEMKAADSAKAAWSLSAGELSVHRNAAGAVGGVDVRGSLQPDEKIFGFGERFDSLDQRGKTLTLWQLDAFDAPSLAGLANQAYKPIPFWHSTSGYSIFWNTSYELRADLGRTHEDSYRVTAHGPILDLYVWPGANEEVLSEYSQLTGKPLLPPAWAFEPWMGGGSRRWAGESGKTSTQAMLDVVTRFRALDIPHSSLYAEGVGMADALLYSKAAPLDLHILAWGRSQPFGWSMEKIKAALPGIPMEKLPLMKGPTGLVHGLSLPNPNSHEYPYFDFTDPKGLDLLRAYWKTMLDLGASGTMVDFGDLVPRNAVFHDGSTGEQMHNWYAHSYQHAEHELFKERRGDNFILFARGAAPGTQVDAGQMSGDHASTFRGLAESISGGLSVSSSGFSNWGSDVGGLVGKPDEEVYLRWIEFGTFSPLMRFHGTTPREPWIFSDAAVATYKKFAWQRENMLPYIYGEAQDASDSGVPMMRALPAVAGDEYMFGDDMLVAPVHEPGETRNVMLPEGRWTDLVTGVPFDAGGHTVKVPIDTIPVYLRAGALVPLELAPSFTLGDSMSGGRLPVLLVTAPQDHATRHRWKLANSEESVELAAEPGVRGFTVTANHWRALEYVSVLGLDAEVTQVTVGGEVLSELGPNASEAFPPGWKRMGGHRILIRLPEAIDHVVQISTK